MTNKGVGWSSEGQQSVKEKKVSGLQCHPRQEQ